MTGLVVAIVVVVLVVAAVVLSKRVKHPEQAATHDDAVTATTSERFYEGVGRPAGPDVDAVITPDQQAEPDGALRSARSPEDESDGPG